VGADLITRKQAVPFTIAFFMGCGIILDRLVPPVLAFIARGL
jgi:hypothetical protein